jgi:ABC-type transport system involved in multi-copper enzyme maturation permease subunit
MSARRIGLVSVQVFRENVRDRVLYGIAAFALLLVAMSFLIGQITAGQDVKVVKDVGLATIDFAGLVMAAVIGVSLVSREIERRSIFSLLAKPLPRWEFIVGKYLGLVLTIAANVGLMTVAFYLLLAWLGWRAPEEVRRSWEAPAADPAMLAAIVLIVAELTLVTAVALFFSTFSSSGLLSLALTIGAWVIGLESADLRQFGDLATSPAAPLVSAIGWIVPAFSIFDVKAAVVHGEALPAMLVAWRVLYAVVYAALTVSAAVVVFSRREFR